MIKRIKPVAEETDNPPIRINHRQHKKMMKSSDTWNSTEPYAHQQSWTGVVPGAAVGEGLEFGSFSLFRDLGLNRTTLPCSMIKIRWIIQREF